jgi:hypothetical protein
MKAAEQNMLLALGSVEPWTPVEGEPGFLWVRDHKVRQVKYVANPKGEVLEDNDMLTIYHIEGVGGGLFVKDKEAVANILMEDEECFDFIRTYVQYVWFQP